MKELQKLLSKDEFNRFIYNVFFIKSTILNIYFAINYYKTPKPSDFIHESFVWRNSKEGHEYWLDIYTRLMRDEGII